MRKWLVSLAIALPLLAQTEADFRNIYDAFNRALRAKLYDAVTAILTEEQIKLYAATPLAQRPMFYGMTTRVPISYEVEYVKVSRDGLRATMLIVGTFAASSGQEKSEMTLQFVKQKDIWRMERPTYGSDPDRRAKPRNLIMGSRADYAETAGAELGGTVLRLVKQDAGTVYVVRRVDEEEAVFVPKALVSRDFVPGSVVSFHAAQHKSQKLKYWAESASLDE
jgi:hypothetical protein